MIIIVACAETDGEGEITLSTSAENARKNVINFISRDTTEFMSEESGEYKGMNE